MTNICATDLKQLSSLLLHSAKFFEEHREKINEGEIKSIIQLLETSSRFIDANAVHLRDQDKPRQIYKLIKKISKRL